MAIGITFAGPVGQSGDGLRGVDQVFSSQNRPPDCAEPDAPMNGRVYHVSFTAGDGNGGSCSGVVRVGAPKSQGPKRAPLDDGAGYDSTLP